MSYLVDALKKAERERQLQRAADMQSLSAVGESAGRVGGRPAMRWLVVALIAGNLALLAYVLGFDGGLDMFADKTSVATATTDGPAEAPESAPAPVARAQSPQKTAAAATAPPVPDKIDPGTSTLRLSEDAASASAAAAARGRVTFAQTPLDDASVPAASPPPQAAPVSAPQTTINGHLYSSLPGRSFILVDGRRYHEGERLSAGPAVESIDAKGATMNYQGQRYHVKGPG